MEIILMFGIILAIVWVGFMLDMRFKKIADVLERIHTLGITKFEISNQRGNANLALQNDLRGIIKLFAKVYFPVAGPKKKKEVKKKKRKSKK